MNRFVNAIILTFGLFTLVVSQKTLAGKCGAVDLQQQVERADFVFKANVIAKVGVISENEVCRVKRAQCGAKIATLNVSKVWKGELSANQVAVFSEDACNCLGSYFPENTVHIVFGKTSESNLYEVVDMGCWTRSIEEVDESFIAELERVAPR